MKVGTNVLGVKSNTVSKYSRAVLSLVCVLSCRNYEGNMRCPLTSYCCYALIRDHQKKQILPRNSVHTKVRTSKVGLRFQQFIFLSVCSVDRAILAVSQTITSCLPRQHF